MEKTLYRSRRRAVATCALVGSVNNNVIISHSVGPDRGQRVQSTGSVAPGAQGSAQRPWLGMVFGG
jgi:hypothetical protein